MKATSLLEKAHEQADRIFQELLPAHGLAVRPAQIRLCHEMIDAMFLGRIALCDAGVGIGKTHAYLVAGLLWQQYQPRGLPRTLTISTSSVALQDAILQEYLPMLSQALMQDGLLAKPVRAVIRKGRERYACDRRLAVRQTAVKASKKISEQRKAALFELDEQIDLDAATGLSAFDRAQVCVPPGCPHGCVNQHNCRYRDFLRGARSADVDIQICNHNYLLADAIHRRQVERPLLKDYHILIVDEAHKLPETARQMYGEAVELSELTELCTLLQREHNGRVARQLRVAVQALMDSLRPDPEQDARGRPFSLSPESRKVLETVIALLRRAARPASGLTYGTAHQLERTAEILCLFQSESANHILYLQHESNGGITLCAASRSTPARLARDLWGGGRPVILASGTLAAGGSFVRIRQRLGLETPARCREFSAQSPFDYKQNCLLYLPNTQSSKEPVDADRLAGQVRTLLQAAHGHALVLFTSYILMREVCDRLRGTVAFPLLEARRGKLQIVQQFKQMPNAVLCAAGSCWEGIDFPGDMVSLLVIVRLPFPVPDPVSEAEREQYPSLQEYIHTAIVPEMQTKLRQGVGRAIRTETDTCAVAILDSRAAIGGRYHTAVRSELPPCPCTDDAADVAQFIRARKGPDYFR